MEFAHQRPQSAPSGSGTELTNEVATNSHVTSGDSHVTNSEKSHVFPSISQSLQWASWGRDPSLPPPPTSTPPFPVDTHVQLLVTGSLHLVGTVMRVLGFTIDDV